MPYIGSAIKNINTRSAIDHQQFLGSTADTITNPGYYTFYVNYSPGNVTVIVAGSHISHTDYIATNGTDVRISNSAVTINANDAVEITGYNIPTSQVLERSDVNITGGKISGIEPLAIADGGTGASTAAQAKINLGVASPTGVTWTKFYLNTNSETKPPTATVTNSGYLGKNWGTWYECTFANAANTSFLSPSSADYDPTLTGITWDGTDSFVGFEQGGVYEFFIQFEVYVPNNASAELQYYGFTTNSSAFTTKSIWSPGDVALSGNNLTVEDYILHTFTNANSSLNSINYILHSDLGTQYYIGQAILTIKKIG